MTNPLFPHLKPIYVEVFTFRGQKILLLNQPGKVYEKREFSSWTPWQ